MQLTDQSTKATLSGVGVGMQGKNWRNRAVRRPQCSNSLYSQPQMTGTPWKRAGLEPSLQYSIQEGGLLCRDLYSERLWGVAYRARAE